MMPDPIQAVAPAPVIPPKVNFNPFQKLNPDAATHFALAAIASVVPVLMSYFNWTPSAIDIQCYQDLSKVFLALGVSTHLDGQ
jgi:hypothetical protein